MRPLLSLCALLALLAAACLTSCDDPTSIPTPSQLNITYSGDPIWRPLETDHPSIAPGNGVDLACRVSLDWTVCPDHDFKRYVLYRSETPGISGSQSSAVIIGTFDDQEDILFVDTFVTWGEKLYYALLTENNSENTVWSNEVSIELPGEEPEPSTLSAETDCLTVYLEWTTSSSPYFLSNSLYRSETGQISSDTASARFMGTFEDISDTTFTDRRVNPGTKYFYAVLTRTLLGLSVWSNEVSVIYYGHPGFPYRLIAQFTALWRASDIIISSTGEYGLQTKYGFYPNNVIRMSNHAIIYELETPTSISNACPLPGGDLVYLASVSDDVIYVADLDMGAVVDSVQMTVIPYGICADPAGGLAYAASYYDQIVSVIDTDSHEVIDWAYTSNNVDDVACHPSGEFVYAISSTGDNVSVIRTSDLKMMAEIEVGNRPVEICSHPDGSSVYVLCSENSTIYEIDCGTNQVVDSWGCSGSPVGMCILPSGEYLYVSDNWKGKVMVYETAGNTQVLSITVPKTPGRMAAAPNGEEVLINSSDDVLVLGL